MLYSLGLIFMVGMGLGWLGKMIKLPPLFGMILAGILLGPYGFSLLDDSLLSISAELRKIALVIILARAGLGLDIEALKKVGRPAFLMCFLPALCEILAMMIVGPIIFQLSLVESAILGTVIAAVSPAVIVPKMLKLIEDGYGKEKSIPQIILAGASLDDILVIVLFSVALGLEESGSLDMMSIFILPISVVTGLLVGIFSGMGLAYFYTKIKLREVVMCIIFISISFFFVTMEDRFGEGIPYAALISVMSMGIYLYQKNQMEAKKISVKLNQCWVGMEVILFVLVGASVDIFYGINAGFGALVLICVGMVCRMIGVYCCFIGTVLNQKERVFCMFSYVPKATVQAAIGGIPLALGLACGNLVLTVAVLSILITAPVGAFLMDMSYEKLLQRGRLNEKK